MNRDAPSKCEGNPSKAGLVQTGLKEAVSVVSRCPQPWVRQDMDMHAEKTLELTHSEKEWGDDVKIPCFTYQVSNGYRVKVAERKLSAADCGKRETAPPIVTVTTDSRKQCI